MCGTADWVSGSGKGSLNCPHLIDYLTLILPLHPALICTGPLSNRRELNEPIPKAVGGGQDSSHGVVQHEEDGRILSLEELLHRLLFVLRHDDLPARDTVPPTVTEGAGTWGFVKAKCLLEASNNPTEKAFYPTNDETSFKS